VLEVIVPDEAVDEADPATLTHWFFEDGALVTAGDLICELLIGKASVEVRAPASGRLKILVPVDSLIGKSGRLAEIG
jgi:pyruvate/2-oxoglutarate dehydrogenase complex dihydrolipoamide acyltransferase (E2) component